MVFIIAAIVVVIILMVVLLYIRYESIKKVLYSLLKNFIEKEGW